MLNRTPVLLLALAAAPGTAVSQQRVLPSVPQSLSLSDAVDLALRYNPGLRQASNNRSSAAWGVRNAYADFIPSLNSSFGINYSGPGSQVFSTTQFTQPATLGSGYNLSLNWGFSGNSLTQPGLAKARLHAVEANIDGARINLRSQVQLQYLAVLQSLAQVEIAKVSVTRNEEALRLAQARQQVGQGTMLEVRQAEVGKGRADVQLLRTQQAATVTKLQLYQQIGVPAPEDPNLLTLSDTFPVTQPTWSLAEILSDAQSANPTLLALRADESAARWSLKSSKSQWLPSLSFSAGWSGYTQKVTNAEPGIANQIAQAEGGAARLRDACDDSNARFLNAGATADDCSIYTVSDQQRELIRSQSLVANSDFPFGFTKSPFGARIGLSWTIFDQFTRPMQVSQASAQADDARESVRSAELNVRTGVSQAYYNLLTAYQSIAIQATNRVAAGEALRLATERYRVGSGTFFELLEQQVGAQQAESDYVNAVYEYHRSVATLESAVGRSLR